MRWIPRNALVLALIETFAPNQSSIFFFDLWYEKGICILADLLYDDISTPVLKSFDDLIIEFDISYKK